MKADADLVRSCLDGDEAAFRELAKRYERPIFNAAYRMLGDREDAADVCQTVFFRVWEHLESYDPERCFYSWIYRIAIHESLRALERRRSPAEVPESARSHEPTPDILVEGREVERAVQRALGDMSDDYRAVIVLRHFLEATYQEMAEVLGVPEKTIKSRLFTARQRLRALLEAQGIVNR